MRTHSSGDWVTRTTLNWSSHRRNVLDLAHLGKHLPSDTHDTDHLIARGHATVEARRIASALWSVAPDHVSVTTQAAFFSQQTTGFLTVLHVVAWPVTSGVSKHTYHVVRPVAAVARLGEWIIVTFSDEETVRFHHTDQVWCSYRHTWGTISIEDRPVAHPEMIELTSVAAYTDRHPCMGGEPLGEYCPTHDLFRCWYCAKAPVPPPPPPIEARSNN